MEVYLKEKRERDEQADAAKAQDNINTRFAQTHGSNIPMAYGGETAYSGGGNMLEPTTKFEGGGTHEQNPNGGIPLGVNSVEEGEVKFKFPDGDYVFSNRLIYNDANK